MQFAGQVRMRLISQLINGTSSVLQELLKYFNGIITGTAFVPSSPVEPVIFCTRKINRSASIYSKLPDVFE